MDRKILSCKKVGLSLRSSVDHQFVRKGLAFCSTPYSEASRGTIESTDWNWHTLGGQESGHEIAILASVTVKVKQIAPINKMEEFV